MIGKLRRVLYGYGAGRGLGDVHVVKSGRIARRIVRRATGKVLDRTVMHWLCSGAVSSKSQAGLS